MKEIEPLMKVAVLILAAILLIPSSVFGQGGATVLTIDHLVPHVSTVPANANEEVDLFVRERVRSDDHGGKPRKAVLMIHGASVPVLPGMDLRHDHYDWALWLAQAGGFDVFMLDFQGSGLSPRPKMNDPCNVPLDQQSILIPNPLFATCPPSFPFQLTNSQSDWSELDAVVDYIRNLRGLDKVALVSWSQGSLRIGPYAVQHPDKVESLLFFAPVYNPEGPVGAGPAGFAPPFPLPQSGRPMALGTRSELMGLWNREIKCEDQVEEGIQDVVWSAIMDSEPIGRNWGPPPAGTPAGSPPEGVMRVRSFFPRWGWNATTARRLSVPVLIIVGTLDIGVELFPKFPRSFFDLYETIPHNHKLLFRVDCTGHFMNWERQRKVLHHISKEWLKHGAVGSYTRGKFFVDTDGTIFPQDPQDPSATCE
jgi:pimeloyl-ACP methyl ester carboxylesterase